MVITSGGKHEDGEDDLFSRLWDLCEKYWASSDRGKNRVFDEMWPTMEDLCNAPQCPDSYEMAKKQRLRGAASLLWD